MFLFIFTSLSEIGLFYYKPKDIFCQHKNNYLRESPLPIILPLFPSLISRKQKNNESFHIASIAQRRVAAHNHIASVPLPSFQENKKTTNHYPSLKSHSGESPLPVILPLFPSLISRKQKNNESFHIASIAQRRVAVRSYYICFPPSFQENKKTTNHSTLLP